jgi:hypothetical protein
VSATKRGTKEPKRPITLPFGTRRPRLKPPKT